jgi:hypothetical protein
MNYAKKQDFIKIGGIIDFRREIDHEYERGGKQAQREREDSHHKE